MVGAAEEKLFAPVVRDDVKGQRSLVVGERGEWRRDLSWLEMRPACGLNFALVAPV